MTIEGFESRKVKIDRDRSKNQLIKFALDKIVNNKILNAFKKLTVKLTSFFTGKTEE